MSKIEWTKKTWNPVIGCSKVSPGCANCYAERMAIRLAHIPGATGDNYSNVVASNQMGGYRFSGKTALVESALEKPLHWKKPQIIFVCSMGDLFHESVPFEWIDKVFAVMALCPQHTFQVLTKRSARMLEYFEETVKGDMAEHIQWCAKGRIEAMAAHLKNNCVIPDLKNWPLPNVWLGVTAEDQQRADERIPDLLECPAAKRFVSVEPMISPVDLTRIPTGSWAYGKVDVMSGFLCGAEPDDIYDYDACPKGGVIKPAGQWDRGECGIDWVICGGESGPGARPMHPDWARSLRDQCQAAGVPFFFKQWGAWLPVHQTTWCHCSQTNRKTSIGEPIYELFDFDENIIATGPTVYLETNEGDVIRVGKKKAGRLLDGIEYSEYPEAVK